MFTSEDTVIHSTDMLLPFKPEVRRERDLPSQLGRKKDGIIDLALPHRLVVMETPVSC